MKAADFLTRCLIATNSCFTTLYPAPFTVPVPVGFANFKAPKFLPFLLVFYLDATDDGIVAEAICGVKLLFRRGALISASSFSRKLDY